MVLEDPRTPPPPRKRRGAASRGEGAPSSSPRSGPPGWARLVLIGVALVLAVVIGRHHLGELLITRDPSLAVMVNGGSHRAWSAHAERLIANAGEDTRQRAEAEAAARRAIARNPIDHAAFRVLGRASAERDDVGAADLYFDAAWRRSRRDTPTALWWFYRSLQDGNYERAFASADSVLRRRNETRDSLYPIISAVVATDEQALSPLVARLRFAPRWRDSFIQHYTDEAASAAGPYRLIDALRRGNSAPTDREMGYYLARLTREGSYQAAYVAWAQHLPADRHDGLSLVYDGDFENAPGIPPFDWRLSPLPQALLEIASSPQRDGSALYVEYSGTTAAPWLVEQMLVLPAGDYVLGVDVLVESLDETDRMVWTVRCERGPVLLELRVPDRATTWQRLQGGISVPAEGCPAQRLMLRAVPGDILAPMVVWVDAVSVERGTFVAPEASERPVRPDPDQLRPTPGASRPDFDLSIGAARTEAEPGSPS